MKMMKRLKTVVKFWNMKKLITKHFTQIQVTQMGTNIK